MAEEMEYRYLNVSSTHSFMRIVRHLPTHSSRSVKVHITNCWAIEINENIYMHTPKKIVLSATENAHNFSERGKVVSSEASNL